MRMCAAKSGTINLHTQKVSQTSTRAVPYKAACVFERDDVESLWRHTEVQAPGKDRDHPRAVQQLQVARLKAHEQRVEKDKHGLLARACGGG